MPSQSNLFINPVNLTKAQSVKLGSQQYTHRKMDIAWDALPRLTLTAKGWSTLSSGQGVMDNYDWLTPQQTQWSDWSHHEKPI